MRETDSDKINVTVNSEFITELSEQGKPLYVFSYTVNIKNNSEFPVQLISRYWLITDGEGKHMEVSGDGVIGKQPIISPNASYQYSSGCHLNTAFGTMQGYYIMHGQNKEKLQVNIPLFQLAQPYCVN
mgnify:CR=1 FL=1